MDLFGGTIRTLETSLNYATTKNKAISNNIANIDTPNYSAKDVVFKDVLNGNLSKGIETTLSHPKHISFGNVDQSFETITKNNTMYNHNSNNVDVDKEMADLAKNQIYYQALVDRMNGKFNNIQTVIRSGG